MDIIKNIDIVIARYKENITWIDTLNLNPRINNIYIYNKFYNESIQLPNVGREAHTYLYHIINNYNNLDDINIFVQGDPFPHSHNFYKKISELINTTDNFDIIPLGNITIENENNINRKHKALHPHGLFLAYFMDLLFDIKIDINQTVNVSYGAQFACSKQAIRNRPIEFYQFLLKFVSHEVRPIEAYIFERLWLYVFNSQIPISNKYKQWNNNYGI